MYTIITLKFNFTLLVRTEVKESLKLYLEVAKIYSRVIINKKLRIVSNSPLV